MLLTINIEEINRAILGQQCKDYNVKFISSQDITGIKMKWERYKVLEVITANNEVYKIKTF